MQEQDKRAIGGLLLLVVISAIIHWQWLVRPGIFTAGDWWYISNAFFKESLSIPQIFNGSDEFGTGSPTPMFAPIMMVGGLLTFVMNNVYPLWERLMFLWPLTLLGTIPMYIFLYRRTFSVAGAIAGTLIYAFNSYILARETSHLFIAMGYLLFAPLLALTLDSVLKNPTVKNGFFFTITVLGFSFYEIRLLYIFTLILVAYVITKIAIREVKVSWRLARIALLSILVIILTQAYWLVPFVLSNASLGYASFASRGLFQSFTTIYHAIALWEFSWNGSTFVDFTTQDFPRWAYGVPFLAFLWILVKPRKEKSGDLWFWTIIACIGIFLAKQANPPFTDAYQWLFTNIPGFQLFRDASKFYLYIAFAYAVLIAATISFIQKRRTSYIIAPMLFIAAVTTAQSIGYVNGTISYLTTAHEVPSTYQFLEETFTKDTSFGRSLWVPATDRFLFYSPTHPRIDTGTILIGGDWSKFVQKTEDVSSFFSQQNTKALLNFGSVAYIGTPFDYLNQTYKWHSHTQEGFSKIIAGIPGLVKIAKEEPRITLWKNNEAKPLVYIANDVTTFDNSPLFYSGEDAGVRNATIFKSDVSSDIYSFFQRSMATIRELQPFSLENIIVEEGRLQTTSKLPDNLEFTTTETKVADYLIEEVYVQRTESTVRIFTKDGDERRMLGEFEAQDAPLVATINGKRLLSLIPNGDEQLLGVARMNPTGNTITIHTEISHPNELLRNPSPEESLWGNAADCANTDGSSPYANKISSSLSPGKEEGKMALTLSAGNHLGCVQSSITPVEGATLYVISFDYSHTAGSPAVIRILSGTTSPITLLSKELGIDSAWRRKEVSFVAPNATGNPFPIYLYQEGSMNDGKIASSSFDAFDVRAYQTVFENTFEYPIPPQEVTTRAFESTDLTVPQPSGYTPQNIIEDGSFQIPGAYVASDCANDNESSAQQNGITSHVKEEEGVRVLSLHALKHTACVRLYLNNVDSAYDYLLSLRYKNVQGSGAAISLFPQRSQSIGPQDLPRHNDTEWHTFRKVIHGSDITDETRLFLYAPAAGGAAAVKFADIEMFSLPILPELSLTSTNPSLPSLNEKHTVIHPTLHVIQSDPLTTPRLLVLSNRYDTGWKLFVRPQGTPNISWWQKVRGETYGTEISSAGHITANAFVNGWILDPEEIQSVLGNNVPPEFVLEYWPQRLMDIGTIISLATLSLYLLFVAIKRFF